MPDDKRQDDDKTGDKGGAGDGGPKFLTAEDLNAALTSREKRFEKKIEGMLAKLAGAAPKADDADDDAGGKAPAGAAGVAPAADPRLARIERELTAARAEAAAEKAERAKEAAAARRNEERSAGATALRDVGVTDPTAARAALALLESDGKITRDDDGSIKFKTVDKYGSDALVDLSAGLSEWAKSEGQVFLPAKPGRGSGANPPKNPGPREKPDPKAEALDDARATLRELLG